MPLPRFLKLAPEKRQRLLAAAAQEFAAHGYEGAALQRITEAAGMSKANVYYYFADKADLYGAAVGEAWERLSPYGRLDPQAVDAQSYWPALRRFYEENLARCREEPWLVAVGKLAYHAPAEGGAAGAVADVFRRGREFLQAWLRRGQALGVVRTDLPEGLLIALLGAIDETADHWMVDHWELLGPAQAEVLALRLFDIVRAMVAPPADARPT